MAVVRHTVKNTVGLSDCSNLISKQIACVNDHPIMLQLTDVITEPDAVLEYRDEVKESRTPIVIDNGSYQCRAGWASSVRPDMIFKNAVAKNRANRKERDWDIQVGNEIVDIEAVRWMVRSPFEHNVVVNYSVQETLLDYTFKHMGINTDGEVLHPVCLTEATANPSHCRKNMSELLFEAYCIPSVSYGIDCLFSYYQNQDDISNATALIVSSGFQSTHVLPLVDGQPDTKNACRVNLGGYNCCAYLQRILQLKHPQYAGEFTLSRMETIIRELANVSRNYHDELDAWCCSQYSLDHSTTVRFKPRGAVGNSKEICSLNKHVLDLEQRLKQAEHRVDEIESIFDLEQDFPEIAAKACADAGCASMDELKTLVNKMQSQIDDVRSRLLDEYHTDAGRKPANHSVPIGVEAIQAPEIIFQPSLVGFDQCGLSGAIEAVLSRYSDQTRAAFSKSVFVTGGNTNVSGFADRVLYDLRHVCPFQSRISVTQANDSSLDAWKGAARWALCDSNQSWITRSEFDEQGWDYIKEHSFSNRYAPSTT